MIRRCNKLDSNWSTPGAEKHMKSLGLEKPCEYIYDDAEKSTLCPHNPLPPAFGSTGGV